MARRLVPDNALPVLEALAETAGRLEKIETEAKELRVARNQQIYEAIKLGATERYTSEIGLVHPSFAHQCSIHKGHPNKAHRPKHKRYKKTPAGDTLPVSAPGAAK